MDLPDLLDVHHYLLGLPRRGVVDIRDLKYDNMNIWFMLLATISILTDVLLQT